MFEPINIVAFIGFVAFIVAVARLGGADASDAVGIFGRPGAIGRAYGIQEQDVPPFRFGGQGA